MAMAGAQRASIDNFNIIASCEALRVLSEDDYFQELPQNWRAIIGKILDKLLHKEQTARFSEKLCSLAMRSCEEDIKTALPDAVKHLIAALNNSSAPTSAPQTGEPSLEFSRSFTPGALNSKLPRSKSTHCREEERPEERYRHHLIPRLVN